MKNTLNINFVDAIHLLASCRFHIAHRSYAGIVNENVDAI